MWKGSGKNNVRTGLECFYTGPVGLVEEGGVGLRTTNSSKSTGGVGLVTGRAGCEGLPRAALRRSVDQGQCGDDGTPEWYLRPPSGRLEGARKKQGFLRDTPSRTLKDSDFVINRQQRNIAGETLGCRPRMFRGRRNRIFSPLSTLNPYATSDIWNDRSPIWCYLHCISIASDIAMFPSAKRLGMARRSLARSQGRTSLVDPS